YSCASEQFHSDANLEAVDQREPNNFKTNGGRWKVTSVHDELVQHGSVNDRRISSRQLAARCSTATGILMSASSAMTAPWITCKCAFIQVPPRRLHLQSAHEHRTWKADWRQVAFSDESRSNL
ncbi:hypothetical protein TNCV_5092981, partial [Trichonephila clavipes]